MINYVSTIVKSNNPNLTILKFAVILGLLLLFILLQRLSTPPHEKKTEGFTQQEQFVLKQNQDVYDGFYADIYDDLHNTTDRCQRELIEIIKMTEPTTKNSVFLDVGSGTGCIVNELQEAGYHAYGIDKSKDMVEYAEKIHTNASFKTGDVMDPMAFEKSTFTHILCTNFTVYLFEDKLTFFRNCYHWTLPNGYLIIHLVEPNKFNMPIKNPNHISNAFSQNANKRRTESNIEYQDFRYSASYRTCQSKDSCGVTFKETFVDRKTNHVRQNEQTMYMNKIEDVLRIANNAGFIIHGKVDMKKINDDENQYIYIFERPM